MVGTRKLLLIKYCANTYRFHHRVASSSIWKCEADLPSFLQLDNPKVNCEKRKNADFEDEIVENSCALTYALKAKTQSLTGISKLTFGKGKTTSGVHPISELSCLEDKHFRNLCDLYELEKVTCHNLGTERKL